MISLLKKHSFLVVGAALSYYSWSSAKPDEVKEVSSRQKAPMIALVEAVAGEQDASTQALIADPFRLTKILKERAERDLAEEAFQEATGRGSPGLAGVPTGGGVAPVGQPGQPFTLRLGSTLTSGDKASAIINGERYRVGEAIPLGTLADPPFLEEVVGRAVVLSWRGERHRLDLIDQREIVLAPRPLAAVSGPGNAEEGDPLVSPESAARSAIPAEDASGEERQLAEGEGQVPE